MTVSFADALQAERSHSDSWWLALSQLRSDGQLPRWVDGLGTTGDLHLARELRLRFDIALRDQLALGKGRASDDAGRQMLVDLIETERTLYLRWWEALRRLRRQKSAPQWVMDQSLSRGPDWDRFDEKRSQVNMIMFGVTTVRGQSGEITR
ncbi:hypothetical protein [Pseudomonas sp. M2]|uniref:hypothetical protein n=1 Tax=Pseudomonas sp. M2 TaxID=228756 RepID=UPI0018CA2175|nr:hypothetical protein [Pseudomonas sp. M2]MBG6126911.1 hypothetical protein [Pseudomonas sp. M2]HDS1748084.1 hypothetical protein [Pseudomonas putida]